MQMKTRILSLIAVIGAVCASATAQSIMDPPFGKPDAIIDLATHQGVDLVKSRWRYSDTRIIEVDSRGPGADLKPSGAPIKTHDYTPHAGMKCPRCGAEMNQHAEKLIPSESAAANLDTEFGVTMIELHSCPACGAAATRNASQFARSD